DIGLHGGLLVHRVVDHAEGRRQVLDITQLEPAQALGADGVFERSGGQQLDTDLVGDHVGEVQTQLGVAVQSGLEARLRSTANFDVAAVFVRIDGHGTGAHDDVASLESLGKGSGDGQGQQGSGESLADHGR